MEKEDVEDGSTSGEEIDIGREHEGELGPDDIEEGDEDDAKQKKRRRRRPNEIVRRFVCDL